jgi:hypothetical protein
MTKGLTKLPPVYLDPTKNITLVMGSNGEPTVDRPSLQGKGSAFGSILIPDILLARWLGVESVLGLKELIDNARRLGTLGDPVELEAPADEKLAKGTILRAWPIQQVIAFLSRYRGDEGQRSRALEAVWTYADQAVMAVLERGLRQSQSLVQSELHAAQARLAQFEAKEKLQLESRKAVENEKKLPPITEDLYPECKAKGGSIVGVVRSCWRDTEIFLRFPRNADHAFVARTRENFVVRDAKDNHSEWKEILVPKTILPIHFIDGDGRGNTLVVGYKITSKIDAAWFPEETPEERQRVMHETSRVMATNMNAYLEAQSLARGEKA